jgi:CheY-like chemotaxis protein
MSAAVMPADRAQSFSAGMVDHVAKPIVAERLVEVLLKWVRRRSNAGAGERL